MVYKKMNKNKYISLYSDQDLLWPVTVKDEAESQENFSSRKKIKGFLKAAFAGAIVAGSIKYLARTTAGFAGLSGFAGVALATASTAVAMTGYDFYKDYKQARDNHLDKSAALQSLLTVDHAKKYGLKLLFNTAGAAVGALTIVGADAVLEHTSAGAWVKNSVSQIWPFNTGIDTTATVDNKQTVIENITPLQEVQTQEIVPVITVDEMIEVSPPSLSEQLAEHFAGQDQMGAALSKTLEQAQDGNARAMKDLAVYLFNGTDALPQSMQNGFEGVTQNKELAVSLYQEAAASGYAPAQADLNYIEQRGWMPESSEPENVLQDIVEPSLPQLDSDEPVSSLAALMSSQDMTPKAESILTGLTAGQSWALESAGIGLLNGTLDLPEGTVVPKGFALSLLEQAAEQGNESAKIDLAYFQYHGLHGIEPNTDKALETIQELGKAWHGGEELLKPAEPVAICEIVEDTNEASCDIQSTEMHAKDYVVINSSAGVSNEFVLADNAASRSTQTFISQNLLHVMNK